MLSCTSAPHMYAKVQIIIQNFLNAILKRLELLNNPTHNCYECLTKKVYYITVLGTDRESPRISESCRENLILESNFSLSLTFALRVLLH